VGVGVGVAVAVAAGGTRVGVGVAVAGTRVGINVAVEVGVGVSITTRVPTCLSIRISWLPAEGLNLKYAVFLVPESSSTVMLLYNCLSSHMDKV